MKKSYMKLRALIAVFSILTLGAIAQPLNGVYTINSANGTTWPSGTNFQTFGALATALNANGVTGPVVVNVAPGSGPYIEQFVFNNISGSSSINKVTINGNNVLVQFNCSSSAPYVIGLNGADWMRINNIQFQTTNSTYGQICTLSGGSNFNYFSACTFSCPANTTSSYQVPLLTTSNLSSQSQGANSANNNTWDGCHMFSGYYCVMMFGLTAQPFQQGNNMINCKIEDFYYYGIYQYYLWNSLVKNCTISRPTRTTLTSMYGILQYYAQGIVFDGNKFMKLYEMNQTSTGTIYLYYAYNWSNPAYGVAKNVFKNNIICDLKWGGSFYGIYYGYDVNAYHNTFSLDHVANTSGGTTYGMYIMNQAGNETDIRNNIISITRGGSGTKYGIYANNPATTSIQGNNIYVAGASGTNYIGWYNQLYTSFTAWQAAGLDVNGGNFNPMFANLATNDLHPTNPAMNNLAPPLGEIFDQEGAVRNQTTPDFGALEFLTPTCSGAPASNTVTVPNYAICPGEDVSMALAYLNPNAGFTYQWQSSTISNVGPFTPISGANSMFYTAPTVTANTYFSVVMTCTAPGGTSIQPVGQVVVAGPTQSTVPAYEDFELVGKPDRLPNCSWSATGAGSSNRTSPNSMSGNRVPRNGTSFGYFSNATPGTSSFFTNKITMNTGITYSAAVWYATEYFGYANWTNLSIMVGPNQSTVGMVQVASVGPAISGPYKLLSGTFTVPTSGDYYVAIKATSNAGNAQYLMIDDLSITIPCQAGSPNASTVIVSASDTTICQGDIISVSAVGADTYTWNTGDQTNSVFNLAPASNTTYVVYGQNAVTGCISTQMVNITVLTPPNVFVVANNPAVCPNQAVILSVFGSNNVVWNPGGSNSTNLTVNPSTTTSYTVSGTGANGCTTDFVQTVTVHPLPNVSATTSNPDACKDDMLMLTASGNGVSYQWFSGISPVVYQGNPITIQAQSSTIFTVVATSSNNCNSSTTVSQNIADCVGLAKNGSNAGGLSVYPNPTSGVFSVVLHSNADKTVNVTDVTGRVIFTTTTNEEMIDVNISNLSAGVYYVSVQSENSTKVIKIVKN